MTHFLIVQFLGKYSIDTNSHLFACYEILLFQNGIGIKEPVNIDRKYGSDDNAR